MFLCKLLAVKWKYQIGPDPTIQVKAFYKDMVEWGESVRKYGVTEVSRSKSIPFMLPPTHYHLQNRIVLLKCFDSKFNDVPPPHIRFVLAPMHDMSVARELRCSQSFISDGVNILLTSEYQHFR